MPPDPTRWRLGSITTTLNVLTSDLMAISYQSSSVANLMTKYARSQTGDGEEAIRIKVAMKFRHDPLWWSGCPGDRRQLPLLKAVDKIFLGDLVIRTCTIT